MSAERTDVLVVGAGQAGLAMSAHLARAGVPHLVLERARIAESWRTGRWDSLVANGPAWHDRFPDKTFPGDPDGFPGKDEVADYMEAFATEISAPVRTGVEVTQVRSLEGRPGFLCETSAGTVEAGAVVAATGAFQTPVIPPLVPPGAAGSTTPIQIHSAEYRNPGQLPEGAVLVVGAGSSGVQIAEELLSAGRRVYLSVGPHDRPPRRYRGRDFVWWLGVLNKWDMEATPGADHVTIAVSGAHGGRTIDFRDLAARGMILVGRTESYGEGALRFAPDLARNIARGDASYLGLLREADAHVAQNGLDLPPEPEAHELGPMPTCAEEPILSLDLAGAGIGTILWATGYSRDYGWLPAGATDADGAPRHNRGVSAEPGIYYLGLPWQTRRGSSFIWGVWFDAGYVADHIVKQRGYAAYRPAAG
ncbi:flavin-containing monooxygenase [Acidimangrovimonas sediminis]|uniref:flavin-containing monooxygenase n=1 Tax=Acidimangrovimonas sediminis TaxID=2056283 RepID=UPI000C8079DE|nr:NAD(P)/FAD-dependent oxidoreductase [Acidimangrovimonas sediminis]